MQEAIAKLWIDESGDGGFKFAKGSSRFFVIVAVYGDNPEEIAGRTLDAIRLRHGLIQGFEFKSSRCRENLKQECLDAIVTLPIEYKAIVVDKKTLRVPALVSHPHQLYCEMVRRLFYDNAPPLRDATLVLDEATAKIHRREFAGVLKQYISHTVVKKITQVQSKNNTMIQVADMIAGSIWRAHEKDDRRWHDMLKSKERILMLF